MCSAYLTTGRMGRLVRASIHAIADGHRIHSVGHVRRVRAAICHGMRVLDDIAILLDGHHLGFVLLVAEVPVLHRQGYTGQDHTDEDDDEYSADVVDGNTIRLFAVVCV